MALQIGGLFAQNDLPDYLYNEVKAMVDRFNPLEPSALPADIQGFFMTRAAFMNEVRTRINSLFSVWYVQPGKLGYAPYLLKLLANVWTITSRCRYLTHTVSHGTNTNGGAAGTQQDSCNTYKVIFKVGNGTVAGRKTNNPEIPPLPVGAATYEIMPRMPTLNKLGSTSKTTNVASSGWSPANIQAMPENYALYSVVEKINTDALKSGKLIVVGATLKNVCAAFAQKALELSNSTFMPGADAFSAECNIEGLGVPTAAVSWASYLVPGFISSNNEAAYGTYNCHTNCHSSCHGNRSRR